MVWMKSFIDVTYRKVGAMTALDWRRGHMGRHIQPLTKCSRAERAACVNRYSQPVLKLRLGSRVAAKMPTKFNHAFPFKMP